MREFACAQAGKLAINPADGTIWMILERGKEDTASTIIHLARDGQVLPERITDLVHARGGRVRSLPYTEGYSTTRLVRRIARLATGRRSVKVGIRFTGKEDLDS